MADMDMQETLNIQINAIQSSFKGTIADLAGALAMMTSERDVLKAQLSKAEEKIKELTDTVDKYKSDGDDRNLSD